MSILYPPRLLREVRLDIEYQMNTSFGPTWRSFIALIQNYEFDNNIGHLFCDGINSKIVSILQIDPFSMCNIRKDLYSILMQTLS